MGNNFGSLHSCWAVRTGAITRSRSHPNLALTPLWWLWVPPHGVVVMLSSLNKAPSLLGGPKHPACSCMTLGRCHRRPSPKFPLLQGRDRRGRGLRALERGAVTTRAAIIRGLGPKHTAVWRAPFPQRTPGLAPKPRTGCVCAFTQTRLALYFHISSFAGDRRYKRCSEGQNVVKNYS